MSWHDPNVDETLMPGKFELNAHSNDCYTAGGPSKLVGLLTITDRNGKDVPNPAFEFDGCFDPHGSDKPTGVDLNPKTPAPTTPAALAIAATALHPDSSGLIQPGLTCSPGQEGCGGTIAATLDGKPLPTATYALAPGKDGTINSSSAHNRRWPEATSSSRSPRHRRCNEAEGNDRRHAAVAVAGAPRTPPPQPGRLSRGGNPRRRGGRAENRLCVCDPPNRAPHSERFPRVAQERQGAAAYLSDAAPEPSG